VIYPPPGDVPHPGQLSPHPLLRTAWGRPCFPFLSCRMVCQNLLEANRRSFSMAPQTPPMPSFCIRDHRSYNQAQKASFFSLTASLTPSVHR